MTEQELIKFERDFRDHLTTKDDIQKILAAYKEDRALCVEFYADKDGESWVACQPEDTKDTCCHIISEISGGDNARTCLTEVRRMEQESSRDDS